MMETKGEHKIKNNLLILGAGQLGQVAKEIAESMDCFKKIGFLDDSNEGAIDSLDNYEKYVTEYSFAIVAIEDAETRIEYIKRLEEACFNIAILVSPNACVSPSAQLMKGVIVGPMAVINTNSTICTGVIVSAGSIVNHDSFVGDVSFLDCGSVVEANSILYAKTVVNSNEVYKSNKQQFKRCTDENYTFEDGM